MQKNLKLIGIVSAIYGLAELCMVFFVHLDCVICPDIIDIQVRIFSCSGIID